MDKGLHRCEENVDPGHIPKAQKAPSDQNRPKPQAQRSQAGFPSHCRFSRCRTTEGGSGREREDQRGLTLILKFVFEGVELVKRAMSAILRVRVSDMYSKPLMKDQRYTVSEKQIDIIGKKYTHLQIV